MNQKRNLASANSLFNLRLLLLGGLGWLGGISLMGTGTVFAQEAPSPSNATPPSAPEPTVPSAEDLLHPELEASSSWQVPTVEVPASANPESITPEPIAAPAVTPEFAPVVIPESAPAESSVPAAVEQPSVSAEETAPVTESKPDALVSPTLTQDASAAFGGDGASNGNGAYIDPTPYSLGATSKPEVVVAERSTGCQLILQPGQEVPTSVCPSKPADNTLAGATDGYSGSGNPGNYDPSSLSVYSLEASAASTSARDFYNLTVRPPARLSNGNVNLLFPLSIPAAITSIFGWRVHPVMGDMRFHSGTDIGAPQGTPVLAAFSGKVDIADIVGGYGLTVVLQHNKGTEQTLYAHLSEIFVEPGEEIKQGEVIGRVGSTGLSTGPHLHFEFRKLTQEGWVVMDAGSALEYALANFVQSLQVAQVDPKSIMPSVFKYSGKALRVAEKVQPKNQQVSQLNSTEMRAN